MRVAGVCRRTSVVLRVRLGSALQIDSRGKVSHGARGGGLLLVVSHRCSLEQPRRFGERLDDFGGAVVPLLPQGGVRRRGRTRPARDDVVPFPRQCREFRAQALGITAYGVRSLERTTDVDLYPAGRRTRLWDTDRPLRHQFCAAIHAAVGGSATSVERNVVVGLGALIPARQHRVHVADPPVLLAQSGA